MSNETYAIVQMWKILETTTCGKVQENYDEYQSSYVIMEDQAESPHYHEPQCLRDIKSFIMNRREQEVILILDTPKRSGSIVPTHKGG